MRGVAVSRKAVLAVMAVVLGLLGQEARAQISGLPPLPPLPSSGTSAQVPALYLSGGTTTPSAQPSSVSSGIRQVQATPGDQPQPPPSIPGGLPGAAEEVPPVSAPGGQPVPNTTDLAAPAAERAFGGGEPTLETAEAESAGESEEEEDTRGLLMKALNFPTDSPVKVYGWIQNSFTGNPSQPSDGVNFGVNPNFKANQWMGNQYYLIFEKPIEQNDKVNFGFRVDNLFGNDWQFNKMYGLFDRAFRPGQFTGYDLAQVYAEVHLPILTKGGLDIKGGRWYTLAGYEVVPAVGRPLLSVPYMFNYGQPFTHFGMVSTFHLTDKINIYNGAINGWDRWINANYKWGYIGGFSWTFNEDKTSLTVITVQGPNQFPNFLPANTPIVPTGATPTPFLAGRRNLGYGGNNRSLFTTVLTHKWGDKLTQVMETDQGFEQNVPGLGPGGTNQNESWYSFGNWFLYDFFGNGKLTGVWRSEVFRDNNGARTGFATTFAEMTLGMICKPKDWLWIRPEARYDWARSGHPYNGGVSNSQFTMGLDVILLY